ncbi:MAG: helix-turn-helix transcriptional regulator [Solirubrobacteraceae bacterium]
MSEIRHEPFAPTVGWELAGGDTIERHCHDDHQLVYVSAGVLEVQTATGSWVVSQDRAVWLPAGTWHEHRFFGSSRFYTVGFPVQEPPWPERDPTLVSVSPLLRELLIACAEPALTRPEVRRVRAVIGDQLKRSRQRPMTLPAPRDPRLVDACALVRNRLGQQITLADLASQVGASQSTLSRLFRHELGMTYPQWRTNVRLRNAAILLSSGTPVTATAHQCGWQTTSSFIDTFRRAMGQTPGFYKVSRLEKRPPSV